MPASAGKRVGGDSNHGNGGGRAGKVEARLGEISCELDPGERPQSITPKHHWIKGMACDPPAEIEPVASSPLDPIPFIRVVDPPPKFRIHVR